MAGLLFPPPVPLGWRPSPGFWGASSGLSRSLLFRGPSAASGVGVGDRPLPLEPGLSSGHSFHLGFIRIHLGGDYRVSRKLPSSHHPKHLCAKREKTMTKRRNQKKSWRYPGNSQLSGSVYSCRGKRAWLCNCRCSSSPCGNVHAGCF